MIPLVKTSASGASGKTGVILGYSAGEDWDSILVGFKNGEVLTFKPIDLELVGFITAAGDKLTTGNIR